MYNFNNIQIMYKLFPKRVISQVGTQYNFFYIAYAYEIGAVS